MGTARTNFFLELPIRMQSDVSRASVQRKKVVRARCDRMYRHTGNDSSNSHDSPNSRSKRLELSRRSATKTNHSLYNRCAFPPRIFLRSSSLTFKAARLDFIFGMLPI